MLNVLQIKQELDTSESSHLPVYGITTN